MPGSVTSNFNGNANNWGYNGQPLYFDWIKKGGNPGGYIEFRDDPAGSDNFYFAAPQKFLGDRGLYQGGAITFDLRNTGTGYDGRNVVISGGGLSLYYEISAPTNNWTHYEIQLLAGAGWRVGADGDAEELPPGPLATEAQMQTVLAHLDKFWILGEFVHGAETGGLDNVSLLPVTWIRYDSPAQGTIEDRSNGFRLIVANASAGDAVVQNLSDRDVKVANALISVDNLTFQGILHGDFTLAAGVTSLTLDVRSIDWNSITGNAEGNVLTAGATRTSLEGLAGDDTLNGGAERDRIRGGTDSDTLNGKAGDDMLHAGSGDDVLTGGRGKDDLIGSTGADTLIGGDSNDNFVFTKGCGEDVILDFADTSRGENDRLLMDDFRRVKLGNDLLLNFGGGDSVLLVNYLAHHKIKDIDEGDVGI